MNNLILNVKDSPYKDLPVLALMTLVLFVFKAIWAVLISTGPLVSDELVYKLNADAIFSLQKIVTPHYPPLYSLALAPALFFKHWYEGMLVINAFLSSLVVPAAWLLARAAGVRNLWLAAALTALIPMHIVYPNILFSENLFVPLFVLALAIALRGCQRGYPEALVFGLVLGLAHLTKYLFLPALPILFFTWLYCRSRNNQECLTKNSTKPYISILLVLFGYGLVVGLWLWYGLSSGFSIGRLFGFGIGIVGLKAKTPTVAAAVMWAAAYSFYVILAWLPVWGIVVIWLSQQGDKAWRIRPEPQHARFLVLTLLLLGCYWLVAVQHSFGAGYNYPVPQYMIGRYLMQLSPIMLVAGVCFLERIADSQSPFRPVKALISVGAMLGFVLLSWWILFNKGIWAFNAGFANREPGTVDVIALVSPQMLLMAVVMVLLIPAIMCFRRNDIRFMVFPVVMIMLVSLVVDAGRMRARQNGLHYRQMAYAAVNPNDQSDILNISTDSEKISHLLSNNFRGKDRAMIMNQKRLAFWGVQQKQILIHDVSTQGVYEFASIKSPTLLISNTLFNIKPLREYSVNNNKYYIYRIDGLDPKVLQSIILTSGKDGK